MATAEDVWQLLAELAQAQKAAQQETEALKAAQRETDRQLQQTDRQLQQTDRQLQETSKQIKELGRELGTQIGGLAKKFGSFTEGFALPSMDRILRERFGMETVSPRVRVRKYGEEIEIDVLVYSNGDRQAAYLVEVKSHPRAEAIDQLKKQLQRFPRFFPEHQEKERYGILAAVDLSEELRQQILAEGLYVARIENDVFTLDVPEDFVPKVW